MHFMHHKVTFSQKRVFLFQKQESLLKAKDILMALKKEVGH